MALKNAIGFVRRIISATQGFRGNLTGNVTGDVVGNITPTEYTDIDTDVPAAAAENDGIVAFCANGNAGAACLIRSNGTNWICMATGATAASS